MAPYLELERNSKMTKKRKTNYIKCKLNIQVNLFDYTYIYTVGLFTRTNLIRSRHSFLSNISVFSSSVLWRLPASSANC